MLFSSIDSDVVDVSVDVDESPDPSPEWFLSRNSKDCLILFCSTAIFVISTISTLYDWGYVDLWGTLPIKFTQTASKKDKTTHANGALVENNIQNNDYDNNDDNHDNNNHDDNTPNHNHNYNHNNDTTSSHNTNNTTNTPSKSKADNTNNTNDTSTTQPAPTTSTAISANTDATTTANTSTNTSTNNSATKERIHDPLRTLIILPPSDPSSGNYNRIYPNSRQPYIFENDYFKTKILMMFRSNPPDPRYSHIFQGKHRMFEFQFQGEFKKLPMSQVYLGVSFRRPVSMGIVQRAVVGAGLSWVKKVSENKRRRRRTRKNRQTFGTLLM